MRQKQLEKIADCILCRKPDYLKGLCSYRDYPFNEAKIYYLDQNARCSKRKKNDPKTK